MKVKPLRFRDSATKDIERAVEYLLSEHAKKAAMDLLDELEKAYDLIRRHPAAGSSRYAHEIDLPALRSWSLTRFPFVVFYFEQEQHIEIWRVLHANRDIPAGLAPPSTTPH
jgi:toxin ParE1/3/4